MNSKYDNGEGTAKHLLKFYLRSIAESVGWKWTADNDAEVEDIITCILNEARKQQKPHVTQS